MARGNAKEKLVDFLDKKAFRPILEAAPDRYEVGERDMLAHVQKATRREQERYHKEYRSAEEVRQRFREDLDSEPARRVNRELEHLGLPTLPSIEPEFERLCGTLGVKG